MEREAAILKLKSLGLPLPDDLLKQVRELEAEKTVVEKESFKERDGKGPMYDGRHHLWLYETPHDADDQEDPCYYDTIPQAWKDEIAGKEIAESMWIPVGAPEKLDKELMQFILSGNPRFDKLKAYKPFFYYVEQARRWGAEPDSIDKLDVGSQEWVDFARKEFIRGEVNHLYWLDRYDTVKDDSQPGGRRDYKASTPQALLCWLRNVRISAVIKKGRHAAITTTMMALASLRTQLIPAYKGVLVTDDVEETGKSIFEDKFLSTMMNRPWWARPQDDFKHIAHSSTLRLMLQFGAGAGKATRKRSTGEYGVFSGKDSQAVNGVTLTDLDIDEGQNVPKLVKIVNERRPQQWGKVGGKMKLLRGTWVWGTGSSDDKGKGSLEQLYSFFKEKMLQGEDTGGWVAIFFDGFCRPGVTPQMFKEEYVRIVGGDDQRVKGQSLQERKAFFNSFYPMTDDDVTSGSVNTVIPPDIIKGHRDRCTHHLPGGTMRGYFVPIFDRSNPMPAGSMFPFLVEGASFEPAKLDDLHAPVYMFKDREDGWLDNYYQGTDPIQSNTGQSKMASNILAASAAQVDVDKKIFHIPASVCWVNHRISGLPHESFKQVKLMGIYYKNHNDLRACPELVEYDQGHNYIEFCKSPPLLCEDSLVLNAELPPMYQTANRSQIGILMREAIKSRSHLDLLNFLAECGPYEFSYEFFSQLLNITQEEVGSKGSIKWGVSDVRRSNDDLVISKVLSFINYKRSGIMPRRIGKEVEEFEMVMEPTRDSGGNMIWQEVQMAV